MRKESESLSIRHTDSDSFVTWVTGVRSLTVTTLITQLWSTIWDLGFDYFDYGLSSPAFLLVCWLVFGFAFSRSWVGESIEGLRAWEFEKAKKQSRFRKGVVRVHNEAENWFLIPPDNHIEIGFLGHREDPGILVQDNPLVSNVFSSDTITYKIRHEFGAQMRDTDEEGKKFIYA